MSDWPKCNARKRGWVDWVDKLPVGPHGGEGYCARRAGHGMKQKDASLTENERRMMRCSRHGAGALISGRNHPSYVNGSRSKAAIELAPARVKRLLEDMIHETPQLLSRQTEIAMWLTRVYDCWDKIGDGMPDPALMLMLAEDALSSHRKDEPVELQILLERIAELCQAGKESEVWWTRMGEAMALMSKLQKDEQEFQMAVGRFVRLEKMQVAAMQMIDWVKEGVATYVTDRDEAASVNDFVANKLEETAAAHAGT